MITLLHGEDIRKSRNVLTELKQSIQGKEIREIEGKSIDDRDLVQALSSHSMFGGDTVVIIEHLFGGLGKKLKRSQELGTILVQNSETIDIILWEDKELGKTAISSLGKNVQVQSFSLPVLIFQFLDSIKPGNNTTALSLYEQVTSTEPPDLVHAMLTKRIKQLLSVKAGKPLEGQQAWQLTRLTNQTRPFTLERLLALYQQLKMMEFNRNSGQGVFDIREATELLLINI